MERLGALANDPDVSVPKCCRHGCPFGIVHPFHQSGVFPALDKATAAVEDSMMHGRALIEHPVPLDQHRNDKRRSSRNACKMTRSLLDLR